MTGDHPLDMGTPPGHGNPPDMGPPRIWTPPPDMGLGPPRDMGLGPPPDMGLGHPPQTWNWDPPPKKKREMKWRRWKTDKKAVKLFTSKIYYMMSGIYNYVLINFIFCWFNNHIYSFIRHFK